MKLAKKLALLAALGVAISSNVVSAYMRSGRVWYNPKTKKEIRIIGDIHPANEYNHESRKNINAALKSTGFKPFWIAEKHHSTQLDVLGYLTRDYIGKNKYAWKCNIGESKNLFSEKKLYYLPFYKDFRNDFSVVMDLRSKIKGFIEHLSFMYAVGGLLACFDLDDFNLDCPANLKYDNAYFEILGLKMTFDSEQFQNNSFYDNANNPLLTTSAGSYICEQLKSDFAKYKKRFLQGFHKTFGPKYIFRIGKLSDITRVFLDQAGNQLLRAEIILKKTNNDVILDVLKEAYNNLQKKILLTKDSLLTQFLNSTSIDNFDQRELEEKVGNFVEGVHIDLPDFGFFAQAAQVSSFTNNTVLLIGERHVVGVEKLLKKAGFECIWVKYTKEFGESLSQEDCEKFFSVQPEKKVETNVGEQFFVKSKL